MKHAHSNCKQPAQGRRKAAIFLFKNIFVQNVVKRHSHSPITVSASKRHEHKPQSKRLQRHARDAKPRGKALREYA